MCYLFISYLELAIKGAAISLTLSQLFIFILMNLYAINKASIREAIQWPDKRMFDDLGEFFGFAIPTALLMWAEWWVFEVFIIMGGLLGVD